MIAQQGSLLGVARGRETAQQLANAPEVKAELARLRKESPVPPPPAEVFPPIRVLAAALETRASKRLLASGLAKARRRIAQLTVINGRLREQNLALRHGFDSPRSAPSSRFDREMLPLITDLLGLYNIDILRSPCRFKPVVRVRHRAMVRLRERGFSLHEIGRFLNRDHGTVIHALKRSHAL